MSDPEPYSTALPAVCCDCGGPMRSRGRDGRCSRCLVPWPRVVCRGWRSSTGVVMGCADPVVQRGDPGGDVISGQCPVCGEMERQAWLRREVREDRRLLRERAKGYGEPGPDADVWDGFRGGE